MTPNLESSIKIMNNPFATKNNIYFQSYYLEKNVDIAINSIKPVNESMSINGETEQFDPMLLHEMKGSSNEDFYINEVEMYLAEGNESYSRSFFGPLVDSLILNEAMVKPSKGDSYHFSQLFKKMLFDTRIRTQKEVLLKYEEIKKRVPFIKYTFTNPTLYKDRNIFYDWSYYTESFYKHLPRKQYFSDRALDVLYAFMNSYIKYNAFTVHGNYNIQTLIIPVNDWSNGNLDSLEYKTHTNPLSMITRFIKTNPERIKSLFNNLNVIFTNGSVYFKFDSDQYTPSEYNKLLSRIRFLINKSSEKDIDIEEIDTDSKSAIILQLADKLEREGNIKLDNLSGGKSDLSDIDNIVVPDDIDVKKSEVMDKLEMIADKYDNAEDAKEELDNNDEEWLSNILMDIQADSGGVKMNAARTKRMEEARANIEKAKIGNRTIKELLQEFKNNEDLPETKIPIDSIDDQWQHLKFTNFNKIYDIRADIVATFLHFQNVTHPMNVVSLNVENTSTSEDYKETWTCVYEDAETGKRSTMTLDIPTLIGNRFMKLAGNEKSLIGQLMLLPIVKTDEDTVQIVSNYNKIFIRRKSPNGASKSSPIVNKLVKALDKYEGKDMKVVAGDNRKICHRYALPIEFSDLAGLYNKISFKDHSYISFNMDDLSKIPIDRDLLPEEDKKRSEDELSKKYTAIYVKNGKREPIVDGLVDMHILHKLMEHDSEEKFNSIYSSVSVSKRLMYADASIMSTTIPVAVILSYTIGLQKMLDTLKVDYKFSETRPSKNLTYIKFLDGYLAYDNTSAEQNMILNGLMECDFSRYSIKEINNKDMWLDILDNFGGRIKADGLDNFYDLMFDPITVEICHRVHLPDNYIDALIYASGLLTDTSYNKHSDITQNRLRTNEVIVGHLYLVLSKAFGNYRNMIKRSKAKVNFTAKKNAVIDSILNHDQTSSDLSTLTPLLEAEAAGKVTFKGLSGMNSDRAFSMDKRTYDKSMLGILGLSTGFAGTVGINRQTTIDANVLNKRGFMNARKPGDLDNTKTFTVMEAMSPLAVNHDDPIRTCMAFTQTVQHQMIVKKSMPNLITTGCDEALPYLTSNKFAYKFGGKKGIVVEVTDDYMIVQDTDTKEYDYIDLREIIQKNSDGGFYVTTKLDSIVKKGDKLHENQIIAYNKSSYSKSIGNKDIKDSLSYNIGTLAKVAVMDTDLGYEDSCVVDNTVSEALATEFVVQKEISINKNTNIYNLVEIGSHIEEGDPLVVFQDVFDEKETNELLASLAKDNDMLSDLGRKQIHSKVTGTVQDIKIYRTCEIDQLSPTLQKVCKEYDDKINKYKKIMDKYKIDKKYTLESTGKLPAEGKLKDTDGVMIEFYIKVYDKFGIGDKLVFGQALKGVNSTIIPIGDEAYTDFRPNEHINAFLTIDGVMARMVTSAQAMGLTNKILIELTRQCQEKLGIKWRPLQEILQDDNN